MNKALVLNSGSSWAAYQIGVLKKLIIEDQLHFDLCAGTGIGAMNAAFIACGEWEALDEFWHDIGTRKLLSINWENPFKKGLFVGKPQQKFIDKFVSEHKLKERGTTLVFSCLNLTSGCEELFAFPGENRLSLSEALMAAVAVPGMSKYGELGKEILVEGTFVRSFLLHQIFKTYTPKETYAVAAYARGKNKVISPKKYTTWMGGLKRTFQLNMSRDVENEIAKTQRDIHALQVYQKNMNQASDLVKSQISDQDLANSLQQILSDHRINSKFCDKTENIPRLIKIISEKEIEFPLWNYNKKKLSALQNEGYSDACNVLASHNNSRD